MKMRTLIISILFVVAIVFGATVGAQMVNRPYHNGSTWSVNYIRIKPGMDTAYMNYLAGQWKKEQEAMKKAGFILSYKVLATEGHSPTDFNLMLMTEYKDLATMEANQDKADALSQTVSGSDMQQMQGYKDRSEIREIIADRLATEIILEPKK